VKRQPSTCNRATFKTLDRDLYGLAQDVRARLRAAVDACALEPDADEDRQAVWLWAVTLGPLMWDVSGSILLELSHGQRRASAILNRSVFEYQARLRYYELKPGKAREAIGQLLERFRKIMRADPTWRIGRDAENIAETEAFLAERDAIARENIKDHVFRTVYGDDTDGYYDAYYGKASGLVHGYETIIRDVHRQHYNGVENPQIDYQGEVWKPDDTAVVLVYHLLEGLVTVSRIAGLKFEIKTFEKRLAAIQGRLGMRILKAS
jgi:hypothetical protein